MQSPNLSLKRTHKRRLGCLASSILVAPFAGRLAKRWACRFGACEGPSAEGEGGSLLASSWLVCEGSGILEAAFAGR